MGLTSLPLVGALFMRRRVRLQGEDRECDAAVAQFRAMKNALRPTGADRRANTPSQRADRSAVKR